MDNDEMTKISLELPKRLKLAGVEEAKRRGINLSALIKNYLSIFLPENIDKSISETRKNHI